MLLMVDNFYCKQQSIFLKKKTACTTAHQDHVLAVQHVRIMYSEYSTSGPVIHSTARQDHVLAVQHLHFSLLSGIAVSPAFLHAQRKREALPLYNQRAV